MKKVPKSVTMFGDTRILRRERQRGVEHRVHHASGRYDALKDLAFDYAFVLTQLSSPH